MFRSKRNSLVRRLWKNRVRDETHFQVEDVDDQVVKAAVHTMLKRLKETQLDTLSRAVETRGAEDTGCVLVPQGDIRLGGRRANAPPHVLCCQLWRWTDLRHVHELKRLSWCQTVNDPLYTCCNPYHWARLQAPESPPPPYSRLPVDCQQLIDQKSSELISNETGGTNQFCSHNLGSSSTSGSPPWCTMAYWELRNRVGRLFPVQKTLVHVFAELAHGDGLCLGTLTQCNATKIESVRRTREKIGLGVTLTLEDGSVWCYNRSKSAVFVNSPTLDPPGTRNLTVFKVQPGFCIKIFDYEKARHYRYLVRNQLEPTMTSSSDGPFDPNAVRISFAKGWGPKYSRQFVTSCPCWLEVFLNPAR